MKLTNSPYLLLRLVRSEPYLLSPICRHDMNSDNFNVILHSYGFQEKCAYWSVDNCSVPFFLQSLYHCYHIRYSDLLRTGRSGDRIPVRTRLSASDQAGTGVHPVSSTMDIGSFPGVKWPRRGVYHPPPSSTEVKETVKLYVYSPSGPSWSFRG